LKELILQDFLDVEYIPLETTDEFLTSAYVQAIGKDIILVRNINQAGGGDIFIFDRTGKGVRKINRRGQGNEEYINIYGLISLDEDNGELFVNCIALKKYWCTTCSGISNVVSSIWIVRINQALIQRLHMLRYIVLTGII
jgi:hypothetical protein